MIQSRPTDLTGNEKFLLGYVTSKDKLSESDGHRQVDPWRCLNDPDNYIYREQHSPAVLSSAQDIWGEAGDEVY